MIACKWSRSASELKSTSNSASFSPPPFTAQREARLDDLHLALLDLERHVLAGRDFRGRLRAGGPRYSLASKDRSIMALLLWIFRKPNWPTKAGVSAGFQRGTGPCKAGRRSCSDLSSPACRQFPAIG